MSKDRVDLHKVNRNLKKEMEKEKGEKWFHSPIVQKNSSDNYFLPEKGIFSLPIRFVNYLYNFSYQAGGITTNGNALEYFLTEVINVEKLLQFIPQRPKENDNQSRRLWKSITHITKNSKKAENIIKNQPEELKKQIEKSVKLGKKLHYFDRIRDKKIAA